MSGVTSGETYRRILKVEAKDDKTFTLTIDRVTFDYNAVPRRGELDRGVALGNDEAAGVEHRELVVEPGSA